MTSRSPVRLAAEQILPLAPLGVRTASDQDLSPAVQLFVERARRVYPDFRLTPERLAEVQQLCERLDSIPLVLELAAARAGVLTPKQMLERLDERLSWLKSTRRDLPARHRSLYSVLDATYAMLDAPARALWGCLAVFQGDFSIDAAKALAPDGDCFSHMETLISMGLLQVAAREEAQRFRMFETLREYAWGMLDPEGRREAQVALIRWVVGEARQRAAQQFTGELGKWLTFWDTEREHLLKALTLAETLEQPATALELLHHTQRYWILRTLYRHAEDALGRMLTRLSEAERRCAHLLQAAWALHTNRPADAHARALDAIALAAPSTSEYAWALYYAVHAAVALSDKAFIQQWGETAAQYTLDAPDPALQIAARRLVAWYQPLEMPHYDWIGANVQRAQQLGDPLWLMLTLLDWIDYCNVNGRYETVLSLCDYLDGLARQLNDSLRLWEVCTMRGYALIQLGRYPEADAQLEQSLYWARLSGEGVSLSLTLLANLRRLQGDTTRAFT
ncbi:MAG: ATP-binding protein, partial [Fimbriimonadales bacterium]